MPCTEFYRCPFLLRPRGPVRIRPSCPGATAAPLAGGHLNAEGRQGREATEAR